MMPKKKRRMLSISILIIVTLIIAISLIVLYLNTDMFRSNQTLFLKYLGKNVEHVKEIEKIFEKTEYENSLENSKYLEETEIKVNYTEDYGTTSENTNNSINDLKLTIDGQVDKVNQYDYKDFKLLKEDNQILNVEYTQSNNIYGIRFSDLFKQYILVENNNLKEFFRKLGYSEQEIENFPDSIEINQDDIFNNIQFSDEEIQNLKEKYLNIINQNFLKENFEKESNQTISVNEQDFIVNAYILKLTNEQLNNIYVNILENLKNEEIILSKIDKIQNFTNENNLNFSDTTNLKEKFVKEVENIIEEINRNNIGTEETRIVVYESQGKTVRTTIEGVDYQIDLDYIQTEQEKMIELTVKENDKETQKITLKKNDKVINLYVKNKEDSEPKLITFEENQKIEDKKCVKKINIKYEEGTNKLEINIITNINIVDDFENSIIFDDQNSIKLNNLEEKQIKTLLNRVNEGVQQKLNKITQEIKIEDLQQILINIGMINDTRMLEGEGVSETEKNRFNSKFEILVSEDIDSEGMLKNIEMIEENIINLQIVSNKELKIEISRQDKNEELIQNLKNFVKKNEKIQYNMKVEYDSETGLVKYIILTIVEE